MRKHNDILRFDVPGLQKLVVELGEKPYRGQQLAEWLYLRRAGDFSEMNTLPGKLRSELAGSYSFIRPQVAERLSAPDGTVRYLLELQGSERVETVAIRSQKRLTVCFSTQVGCGLGCVFCATGTLGLTRSLLPGEMLSQLSVVADDFPDARISNVVAMGQGEPFAAYDATLSALRMMNSPALFGIGARHITVSTAGLVDKIRRFAGEPEQFTLAVSLHSADQGVRDYLMPGLKSQPLSQLREALLFYSRTTSRRPSLEYALIEGVNDTKQALASLLAFCDVEAPGFHVNLLRFNPSGAGSDRVFAEAVDASDKGASTATIKKPVVASQTSTKPLTGSGTDAFIRFERALQNAGISVSRRASKGESIAAACGQLANKRGSSGTGTPALTS